MLLADADETSKALNIYGDFSPLDVDDYRDLILMNILDAQIDNFLSISEINQQLKVEHFQETGYYRPQKKETARQNGLSV